MDYKAIIKEVWHKDPSGLITGLYNVGILGVNSVVRAGRITDWITKRGLQGILESDQSVLRSTYTRPVQYSERAYEATIGNVASLYPELTLHHIEIVDQVMVVLGMDDSGTCQVTIRGSVTTENFVDDLNDDIQWSEKMHSMVHDGYLEIARGIALIVTDYTGAMLSRWPDKERLDVQIQGHSMGGGLAVMTGNLLTLEGKVNVTGICSVAGPKVIQADYGNLPVTHIFHVQDPVPYLPVWTIITPYRHQGKRLLIQPDGSMALYKDGLSTDLYNSIWTLTYPLSVSAHSQYQKHFKESS